MGQNLGILPTRSFFKSENINSGSPFSRKRCTGRYSTRKKNVFRIRFPSLVQSPSQRERGGTLFHLTPDCPAQLGTIVQAILVRKSLFPLRPENLSRVFLKNIFRYLRKYVIVLVIVLSHIVTHYLA